MTEPATIRCYACGNAVAYPAHACPRCGAFLVLTPQRERVGLAYALNRLDELVASGMLDAATAERLRDRWTADLAALSGSKAAAPTPGHQIAADRAAAAPVERAALPSELRADQAPVLLLYVGAFLIVVSALVLVNVSGEQFPDAAKLALMLIGTLGFIGAGLVCHRIPRVVPAGRTFLAIGALLVPVDVIATYVLFLRRSPLEDPELWLAGSLVAATLYAALALAGYGSFYVRGFVVAAVSTILALHHVVGLDQVWQAPALLALAAALVGAARLDPGGAIRALLPALRTPAWIVAVIAALVASAVPLFTFREAGTEQRVATLVSAALLTVVGLLDGERRWARRIALVSGGLAVLSVVFVARGDAGAFAVAFLALAVAYAFGGRAPAVRALTGLRSDAETLGYAALVGAGLLVPHYEREPLNGAVVVLGAAALLAALEHLRRDVARPAVTPIGTLGLDRVRLYLSVALLHFGGRYAMLALLPDATVLRDGPNAIALGFLPASLAVASATALAASRGHAWRDALAVATLASAISVTALAAADRAPIALGYAVAIVAAAVAAREPRLTWLAGAFGWVALLAWLDRTAPLAHIPLRVLGVAVLVYVSAFVGALRSERWARPARDVALAGAAISAWIGLEQAVDAERVLRSSGWADASFALAVLGGFAAIESLGRRSFALGAGSSAAVLGSVLMIIARTEPRDVQAYTFPMGVWLLGLAVMALRYAPRDWEITVPLEGAGALLLLVPPYLASWQPDGFGHGLRVLVAALALIALGITFRRRWPVAIAVGALGLAAIRVLVDVADRLPNWLSFGLSGTFLLAVGFTLLVQRERWTQLQRRMQDWWQRWEPDRRAAPGPARPTS